MPMIRYQIRNEYGLADPELYGAADRDDPEAILEGVAMAGLVGVLRQLGDLAEFAAELFHELHEEVMATVGRGHGLMLRVQQLETEFPSIEKAFLSQTNHSKFAYNAGIDWHANLRTDQNLVTQGDMPRFILNSYEECRGPPRLFMLDRFDVAGAGACLKRYTDPSFFKMELASSGMMEEDVQRERKTYKIKKVSRWRNGEAVESFLAPDSNSNLQPGRSEKVPEKNPKRRVNLKPRRLNVVDTSSTRSYMENLLEVHSPEQKVLLEISRNQLDENTNSTNLNELAHPGHEIVIDKLDKYFSSRDNSVQLPSKQISELCTNEQETKKIKDEKCLETLPNPFGKLGKMYPTSHTLEKKEVLTDCDTTTKDSGISYKFGKAEKSPLALREVYQHKFPSNAQYLTEDYQRKFSADTKCETEGLADSFVSDDIGSEVENYVDALNTMESEMETDFERKFKLEPVLVNVGSQGMLSSEIKGQEELIAQFSDQEFVEKSTEPSGLENMYYREISSVSKSDDLSKLDDVQPSQQCINGFGIPVDSGNISKEMVKNCEVVEIKSSVQLLSDGTYHAEPPICNLGSEVGETSFDSGNTSEGIVRNSEVVEIKSSVQLLSDGTRHTESPICNLGSEVGETSSDSGDIIEEIVRNSEVVEIKSSVQLLSDGPYHAESPICNLVSEVGEASSDSGDTSEEIVRNSKVGEIKSSVQLLSDGPYHAESPICDLGSEVGEASSDSGAAELAPHLINICPQRSSNEAESATSDSNERFACDFKSDHEVADNLDDNLPCKAEISEPILRDIPPLEHVEELISEDIGGINDILELISQKQDERNIAEASSENGEELLRCEPVDSRKQDLEACSSGNMSPTTYTQDPEISSLGVQSDTLATEMEKILQPEDQVFPASLRGTHDVKNLNGTSLRSSVPDQTHPTRDDEMLESSPKQNESIFEDVSAGYANHSTRSFTWHSGKPQELIEQDREAKEVLNFAVPSKGISDTQSSMGPGNADGTIKSEILWHSILPHEFKHFSEAEEPQVTQNVESTEFAQSSSMKETFSCDMELRSEPVLVGDDFGLPSGSSLIEQDWEAKELLNFAVPSEGISDTQSSMGLGNADDTIKTEILWHSILPLEFKHFSEAEEPQVTQNVESTEFAQSCSMKETFSCDMELQSEPVLVGDDFGLLSGSSLIEQGREAKEVLNFAVPSEVISDTQSSMGLGNADDTKTEILWHSILPLEFKHFSEAEEPHVTQNVESTEFTQSCSMKETFSCDMELQSGLVLVGDDFGLPSGSSISNHHKDELKNEQLIEYDDILTKSSPAESAANYHEPSSRYSSELSGFHVQTEDIYVSHDADQDGNKLFIHEVSSSDFLDQDLSDPADSKLFNDTCHTNPPQHAQTNEDPYIDEENPLYSLERDKDRDETPSDHFFVQPAISVEQASSAPALNEPNVVASCQGGNHLEASVILEQDNIGKNSVELSDKPSEIGLEQDPCGIIPNENINEMDMSPLSTGICRQLEPESLSAVLSTSSLSTPESASQEFSKPQISDPASSIQLQETPPLPPLPPLEWRLGKLQADSLIALKDDAHQHGLLSFHTERVRPLRLSELPPIVGDERLQHGIQRGIIHPPTNVSLSEPCIEDDRLIYFRDELWGGLLQPSNPNAKPRSIRDRPRHPLIDAVAAHDKSKLRKISELVQPSARPEGDESDTFLDQIRNKTFNLKPTTTMKPNMKGPQTNLKVAAILEKANAIRHACAGSDEDDDGDNWNDPW